MIVGVVLSVLGTVITLFSLTCLTMTSVEEFTKAKASLTAGTVFIIAGRVTDKRIWEHLTESSLVRWWNEDKPSTGIANINHPLIIFVLWSLLFLCSLLSWFAHILYEVNKSPRLCISCLLGVCGIAGASIYANQIVASFRMSTYTNYGGGYEGYGGNMQGGMGGMPT